MNILVTGSLGFLGSKLAARLAAEGHTVTGWDNYTNNCVSQDFQKGPNNRQTRYTDVSKGHVFADNAWRKTVDVVFHTAAVSRTPTAIEKPERCNEVNVTGSLNVFRAFPNARIVHSSSNVVYARPNPYQASKLAAELHATSCNEVYDSNIICLRYSNIIGPGYRQGDPAVLAALRECRAAHGYVKVTGDGTQTRNFTYVSDIVDANLLAMASDYKGIVDVSTGVVTSMNEFAGYFNCPVKYIGDRLGDTKHIHQESALAREVLGWVPKVEFGDAMRRSLA